MASKSQIEWTDMTWNPVTGCSKVSQGCKYCYADRMSKRLNAMGLEKYKNGFEVTLHPDLINVPLTWTKPRRVFVNSMSDLFHEDVPFDFIQRVFAVMEKCPQHVFQVLTKRSERLLELSEMLIWPNNVWMGVSIEDHRVLDRVRHLQDVPAAIRFLSCEPLIGSVNELPLSGIHWIIVGGESGPGARPMKKEWVDEILNQCRSASVPFFFKQWGGVRKKRAGRTLRGRTFDEFPKTNFLSAD